jgi:broad specificity phosphatase PhoE
MKKNDFLKCFFLFVFVMSTSLTLAQDETTTYYFIRHAEKDRSDATNKNPSLTEQGLKRAQDWATILKDVELDAVYSTNYNRTQQTAAPTAKHHSLEVLDYDPRTLYSEKFKTATQGKTVLIVGHSNTTPAFVNTILKERKYENIDDHNNGNLYIVTLAGDTKTMQLLHFN